MRSFELLEELLLRLGRGEPGEPLEDGDGIVLRVAELLLQLLDVDLAVAEPLLAPLELVELRVDLLFLLEHALLDLHDLVPAVLDLGLDLGPEDDRLLARVDLGLTANRVGLPLGVSEDPAPRRLRLADAGARERRQKHRSRERPDEDSDHHRSDREHVPSVERSRLPRNRPRCSHRHSA